MMCDLGANRERSYSKGRRQEGKTKLVGVDVLERARRKTLFLDREQALKCGNEGRIFHFELDTSELDVEETTEKVWELLQEVAAKR